MRIAIIGPTYPIRGGISHFTTLLAEELAKENEVIVFSLENFYRSPLYKGKQIEDNSKDKIECKKAKVVIELSMNPLTWFSTAKKINDFNPDLVIIKWWEIYLAPIYITLLNQLNCKNVTIICHNVLPHKRKPFDEVLTKIVFNKSSKIVTHSSNETKVVRRLVPKKSIITAFHPIYNVFNTKKISKNVAKKKLRVKGKMILFFGFVREYKGLIYLIRAMPDVLKKIKDAKLVIAGEFWENKQKYLDEIKNLDIEKNVIIFDKYISNEEVPVFFYAADVVVHPCITATQSGVIQTAIGFNKPIITTNVIKLNNNNVIFTKEKSPNELTKAITNFFNRNKQKNIIFKKSTFLEYVKLIGEAR